MSRAAVRSLLLCVAIAASVTIVACEKKLSPTGPQSRLLRSTSSLAGEGIAPSPPSPGVVAGGFCTSGKGYFRNSLDALQQINRYLAAGATGSEIFHVGTGNAYTWSKTGQNVTVSHANQSVSVDAGVAAMQQALGSSGKPGALTSSATNPTDLGTSGNLGAQALTLKINLRLSEAFVTPATGFSGLSLVDMESVQLGGVPLTFAQANALDGQAALQIADAADAAIGGGAVPYGLSISQVTSLLELLNGAYESCGTSSFAQSHLYQPYIESSAFSGRRPSTVSDFAFKPQYNRFQGVVVSVGTGCTDADYASFPAGAIALVERGGCTFQVKVINANTHHASGVIIFNSTPETGGDCPATPTPGSTRCEALVGMGGTTPVAIPAAFVQRSTGLLLRNASGPVTVTVQQ